MRFIYFSILSLFLALNGFGQRQKISINNEWKFSKMDVSDFDKLALADSYWQVLNLPHTWNKEDAFDDERGYYQGIGCYRKWFSVDSSWLNKKAWIYFEGSNHSTEVFLNEKLVGKHVGGYTAFCFDLTPHLKVNAPNLLAVKVSNAADPNVAPISADFNFYGGIYRDVFLVKTEKTHFSFGNMALSGMQVSIPSISKEKAKIQTAISVEKNENQPLTLQIEVLDKAGLKVSSSKKNIGKTEQLNSIQINLPEISKPHLWSPENPYLYQVKATLLVNNKVLDEISEPLGLRWFKFDPATGFYLNGSPLKLIGTCRHQDFQGLGNALPDHIHRSDMALLKEMGGNFVRISHYPQDPSLLQACDELGILAWEEIPIVNEISLSKAFTESCLGQFKEMIRQHFNHPSIITWGYMNEVLLQLGKQKTDSAKKAHSAGTLVLAKLLDSTARVLDPSRPTTMALHYSKLYQESGVANVTPIKGWNLYHGWYHDKFEDFGPFIDEDFKKNPDKSFIISEYGAGSDLRIHSKFPETYDFSCEYQQLYHEIYLRQIMARPNIAAATLWNLVDFGSEGRKESMEHINNKGLVTMNRIKKDIFYFYKAALSKSPITHIAARDWPVRNGEAASKEQNACDWQLKVYSNESEVELFVNGISLGKQKVDFYTSTWKILLPDGNHKIEAKGAKSGDVFFIRNTVRKAVNDPDFDQLAVNVGAKFQFIDSDGGLCWEADQAYSPEKGWGFVGGFPYRSGRNRIGSQANIALTLKDPLYQTMQDSISAYKLDLLPGSYELELHFAELNQKIRQSDPYTDFKNGVVVSKNNKRIFSIYANNQLIAKDFEPIGSNGMQAAKSLKTIVRLTNPGLEITFKASAGNASLNALFVKKIK